MTKALIPAVLPALLIVAGCGKPAEQTAKPAAPAAMENMAMPTAAKTGKATGMTGPH
jgi:hypothetical protein